MAQPEPRPARDGKRKAAFPCAVPIGRALALTLLGPALVAVAQPVPPWTALAAAGFCGALCLWPVATAPEPEKPSEEPDPAAVAVESVAGSVLDAFPEPVIVLDGLLHIRYGNPAAHGAFGSLALGSAIALRFRSPDFLSALEIAVTSEGGGKATLTEGRVSGRVWAVDVVPMAFPQARPTSLFALVLRDRSAERRIDRMRSDFVANASHELRTPLASVIGFIETLQGPARDDPVARDRFLGIMREQAARMARLIDDLLSLSQIEMKRPPPSDRTVDLAELLGDVRRILEPLLADSGVEAELEIPAGNWMVWGERDELLQVFSNLVENACKYGASGGRVILSLATEEEGRGGVRATVRDFGPGIASEHVPRLTERFYRVDVASSRAKRGTGLGLSIVRNILQRHAARLVVWSELGTGSAFSVVFPESKMSKKKQ